MNRILCVLLLAAGACASAPVVPDSELAILGGKGLEGVETARAEVTAARQALAARRAEATAAAREIRIAEYAIRRDEADLAVAGLRFEAVQETHDADAMLPAKGRRAQAERALAVSQAELSYRRAAYDLHDALVDEAEAAEAVGVARLERAKLEAVLGSGAALLPAQAQRKSSFEVQVARTEATLSERSARVVKARGELQAAESAWKAASAAP